MKKGSKTLGDLVVKPRQGAGYGYTQQTRSFHGRNPVTRARHQLNTVSGDGGRLNGTRFQVLGLSELSSRCLRVQRFSETGAETTTSHGIYYPPREVWNDPDWVRQLAESSIKNGKNVRDSLKLPASIQCVVPSTTQTGSTSSNGELRIDLLEEYIDHLIRVLTAENVKIPKEREAKVAAGLYATALRRTAGALRRHDTANQETAPPAKSDYKTLTDLYDRATRHCSSLSPSGSTNTEWEPVIFNALLDSLRTVNTAGACLRLLRERVSKEGELSNSTLLLALQALSECSVKDLPRRSESLSTADKMHSLPNFATYLVTAYMKKNTGVPVSTSCWNQLLNVFLVHGFPRFPVHFGRKSLESLSIPSLTAGGHANATTISHDSATALDFESSWDCMYQLRSQKTAVPIVSSSSSNKTSKDKHFRRPFVDRFLSGFQGITASEKQTLSKSIKNELYSERQRALALARSGALGRFPRFVVRHETLWSIRGGFLLPLEGERYGKYLLDGVVSRTAWDSISKANLQKWDNISNSCQASLHLSRLLSLDYSLATAYSNQLVEESGGKSSGKLGKVPRDGANESMKDCSTGRFDPWAYARGKSGEKVTHQSPDSFGFTDLMKLSAGTVRGSIGQRPQRSARIRMQPFDYRSDVYLPPIQDAGKMGVATRTHRTLSLLSGIWREMRHSGRFPNGNTAALSVRLLARQPSCDLGSMLHMERLVKENGLIANEEALGALTQGYVAIGHLAKAFQLLNRAVFEKSKWSNVPQHGEVLQRQCSDDTLSSTSSSWKSGFVTQPERETKVGRSSGSETASYNNVVHWKISPRPLAAIMSSLGSQTLHRESVYALEFALQSGLIPTSKMFSIGIRSLAATLNTSRRSIPPSEASSTAVRRYVLNQLSELDHHLTLSDLYYWVIRIYSPAGYDEGKDHAFSRSSRELSSYLPEWSAYRPPASIRDSTPVKEMIPGPPIKVQLALLRALGCTGDTKRLNEVLDVAIKHYETHSTSSSDTDGQLKGSSFPEIPRALIEGFMKAFAIAGHADRGIELAKWYWESNGAALSESVLCHIFRNINSIGQLHHLTEGLKLMAQMQVEPSDKTRRALLECCFHLAQTQHPVPATLAQKYSHPAPASEVKHEGSNFNKWKASTPNGEALEVYGAGRNPLERYSIFASEEVRKALAEEYPSLPADQEESHDLTKAVKVTQRMAKEVVDYLYFQLENSASTHGDVNPLQDSDGWSGFESGVEMLKLALLEWPVSEKAATWKKSKGNLPRERLSLDQYLHQQKREARRQMLDSQKSLWWTAKHIAQRDQHKDTTAPEAITLETVSNAPWKSRVGYRLSQPAEAMPASETDDYTNALDELTENCVSATSACDWPRVLESVTKNLNRKIGSQVEQEGSMRGWQGDSGKKLIEEQPGEKFVVSANNGEAAATDRLVTDAFDGVDVSFGDSGDVLLDFNWESSPQMAEDQHMNR